MLKEQRQRDDLVATRLVERENIVLVLVVGTAREFHLLDGLVDRARIAALEHLFDTDGLLDCLWQDLLADEEESAFLLVHILRLQWILFF